MELDQPLLQKVNFALLKLEEKSNNLLASLRNENYADSSILTLKRILPADDIYDGKFEY